MDIKNKTKLQLPDWFEDTARTLCRRAEIIPASVTIIVKQRNKPWWWKERHKMSKRTLNRVMRHANGASGFADYDRRTITIRLTAKTEREDIEFVLAHELGHIKDMREHQADVRYKPTESFATKFAFGCGCYPKGKYPGTKRLRG